VTTTSFPWVSSFVFTPLLRPSLLLQVEEERENVEEEEEGKETEEEKEQKKEKGVGEEGKRESQRCIMRQGGWSTSVQETVHRVWRAF